jgi:hypothetical protein
MSMLAKSLKRLYDNKRITIEKVDEIYVKGELTKEEYYYITGTYPKEQTEG